jgi:hypothetical protein
MTVDSLLYCLQQYSDSINFNWGGLIYPGVDYSFKRFGIDSTNLRTQIPISCLWGFVCNTSNSGSHWIAMTMKYVAEKSDASFRIELEIFDSFGGARNVHSELKKCIRTMIKQFKLNYYDFNKISVYRLNETCSFQQFGAECGMYCIYFLSKRAQGISFGEIVKELKSKNSTDIFMRQQREEYFNFI